ncbi:hypothetical protein GW17_00045280 [Ensete ventricosum]|nr:hypothetical protein GW17_00045280 [Ensete ventricosum]
MADLPQWQRKSRARLHQVQVQVRQEPWDHARPYVTLAKDIDELRYSRPPISKYKSLPWAQELKKLQRELGVPVFTVGPFCKMSPGTQTSLQDMDRGCVGWLDKQPPISTGSLASVDEKELVKSSWGLANIDNHFYRSSGQVRFTATPRELTCQKS